MNINDFIKNFKGGARTNRFVVSCVTAPGGASDLGASASSGTGKVGNAEAAFNAAKSPPYLAGIQAYPIHIRATKIPEISMGVIPVNYRGKTVPFPGDRKINDWEITVLDDVTVQQQAKAGASVTPDQYLHLHRAFMDWSRSITPTDARLGTMNFDDATQWNNYKSGNVWMVQQLDHAAITDSAESPTPMLRSFAMYNCWPKEVGPLQLDMSSDNSINSFRVVLSYTHMDPWDAGGGTMVW